MPKYTSDKEILRNLPVKTIKEFIRKAGNEMMEWAGHQYGANHLFFQEYRVYVRCPKSGQRSLTSYGGLSPRGYPYVNLTIDSAMRTWEPSYYSEYPHISSDDDIGDVPGVNWKEYAVLLLAHEIAHTIDQCLEYSAIFIDHFPDIPCTHEYDDKGMANGHEWRWQSIYAAIRKQFFRADFIDNVNLRTEGERARNLNKPSLGKVRIPRGYGMYRNQLVSGYYDLIRSFKPHQGMDEVNKFGDGTITIRTPAGQLLRVSVLERQCTFDADK